LGQHGYYGTELGRSIVTDENPDAGERDVTKPETAESEIAESDGGISDRPESDAADGPVSKSERRRVTVSVRSLVRALVIVAVVSALGALGWLYAGAQQKLDANIRESKSNARAEQIALDYAVNAAAMNFEDMNAWKAKLVAGTTPELSTKLTKAATSIEQILVPLQWTSTAKPLVAKVRTHTGSTYIVDAFVSVMTKTVQAPDPLQSTATYSVTLDSGNDWKIADVGGVGATLGDK
jgi:Mce-associated membrane protein